MDKAPRGVLNSNQDSLNAGCCNSRGYVESLHHLLPLERFHRTRIEGCSDSKGTPRSAQARPLLPVAARLRQVRELGGATPLSLRQLGEGDAGAEETEQGAKH